MKPEYVLAILQDNQRKDDAITRLRETLIDFENCDLWPVFSKDAVSSKATKALERDPDY